MKDKRRKLKDIDIDEVSFVDAPANRIPFYIIKSANKSRSIKMFKELLASIKKFLGGEELTITKSESVDSDVAAVTKAMGVLDNFSTVMPAAVVDSIETIAKAYVGVLLKAADKPKEDGEEDLEKAGRKVSNATAAKLLDMRDVIDELVPEDIRKAHEEETELTPMEKKLWAKIQELEKEKVEKKDDEEPDDPMKAIEKRLAAIEKHGAKKQSLGNENEDDETPDELKKKENGDELGSIGGMGKYFDEPDLMT